ncbi:anti-sigma factor family protein [Peribacillus simplex]|uniref:anti-sigma factor family protein n=1 Tax=Peribacillus simplex TaxID=1478 RepID=UPI000BA66D8B|nr:anti-sigma factor [Peribacillus simplex]PAL10759.1 anti-sigma factor [Peribacillus simplex]
MNCHEEIIEYMHDYLDEDIKPEHKEVLREHLHDCAECRDYFHEMKKAVALVQSTSHIKAPDDFTAKVMAQLPKETKTTGAKRWFKSHPFMTAAAMFIILMTGSVFSTYNQDEHFSVSKQPNLVVEGETVIVPEGETIKGNVVVQNGNIQIDGEVEGDVTVINGHKYMSKAGNVTGSIHVIDQAFEWMWYKVKDTATSLVPTKEEKKE